MQILGCDLHKNAFGDRAAPEPSGELQRSPDPLAVIRGKGGTEGKERVGNREKEEREGREGREGVGRDGEGKGLRG